MRVTGLSRSQVRKLSPERFSEAVQLQAQREQDRRAGRVQGATFEDSTRERDRVDKMLREAKPSDAGKPLPSTPPSLEVPGSFNSINLPTRPLSDADAADAAGDEGGGGGSTGNSDNFPLIDLELCDGTIVRVRGLVNPE